MTIVMRQKTPQELHYIPTLAYGTHVRMIREGCPEFARRGVVIFVLPNPSNHHENQWYDVKFEDHTSGRFLERDLVRIS